MGSVHGLQGRLDVVEEGIHVHELDVVGDLLVGPLGADRAEVGKTLSCDFRRLS